MKESKVIKKRLWVMLLIMLIVVFLSMTITSAKKKVMAYSWGLDGLLFSTAQTSGSDYFSLDYSTFSDNRAISLPFKKGSTELPIGISTGWFEAAQESIQKSEYNVTWTEQTHLSGIKGAFQAPNRAHNMRTYFTQEGIQVVPRTSKKPNWIWGLSLNGFGYKDDIHPIKPAKLSVSNNRIDYKRASLTEWYINDNRGLEQGFVLHEPPKLERVTSNQWIALRMNLYGNLKATIDSSANAVKFSTSRNIDAVLYRELHAFDATGRELPTKFALVDKTIDILVDTQGAIYPITVDPIASSPNWTGESNQADSRFGWSVGTAGDVNDDGYSDVIVGAYDYDNGESDEGRAFVYHSSASGLSTTPNWTAEANQADASFGYSVGTAGDVNGDGYSDVIVGARYFGSLGEGRAFVYHGSASGLSTTANWSADAGLYGWFGWSVGTAGDVNGDGYSDVIVGAVNYDSNGDWQGGALVYHGSASGLSTTANWTAQSDLPYAYFGWSVGTAGDVNGDGYSDVIVGAKGYNNGEANEGAAFVYYGSASGLSTTPNWTDEGNQASAFFGYSVGTAGDVNGDGYDDVIVGAEFYNIKGRAFVYHGSASGLNTTADWIAETDRNGNFGHSVGTAGDVNADGYSDVIVGALGYSNGESNEGAAFVYYGSAAGLSTTADWIGEINQAGAEFGSSVGTAGDVNADGYSDVIIGAHGYSNGPDFEGGAFVYYGYPSIIVPPVIDIKANSSDGPITITTTDTLAVTVSLDSGDYDGEIANWYIVGYTPAAAGWYHYEYASHSWKPGFALTVRTSLRDISDIIVLQKFGLPVGEYTFFFHIGLDTGQLFSDSVKVNVN